MAIQFVGYSTAGSGAAVSTLTLSLTALTGGISSSVATNDLVVVFSGWRSTSNDNPGVTSPTAVEVADLYSAASGSYDTNLSAAYFIAGSTPPTSTTVSASNNSSYPNAATALVFRGVDLTNPIDATTTTLTGAAGSTLTPASITPVTTGAVCVIGAMLCSAGAGTWTVSTGFTATGNVGTQSNTPTYACTHRCAYLTGLTSGVAVNPSSWTTTNGGPGSSFAAVTMALRPSFGDTKYWSGASWDVKPVKYWNGTSWVIKPLKRWNGSSWVKTNY